MGDNSACVLRPPVCQVQTRKCQGLATQVKSAGPLRTTSVIDELDE